MTTGTIDKNNISPMVMVVEDDAWKLQIKKECFEKRGCRVITLQHSDEAIRRIFTSPSLDLILTDIDLDGSGIDKSGVALARFVKDLDLDTPLCGYSSQFEDEQLSKEEKKYFDCWYPKAELAKNINIMYDELKKRALVHRLGKIEEAENIMNALRQKHSIKAEEFEQIRELILNADSPSEIERILHDANYTLRILQPTDVKSLSNPVLIWLRKSEDFVEAEVYGHSSLYSHGETEEEAIEKLVELMQLFAEDTINDEASKYQGVALKLREFLTFVFKPKR